MLNVPVESVADEDEESVEVACVVSEEVVEDESVEDEAVEVAAAESEVDVEEESVEVDDEESLVEVDVEDESVELEPAWLFPLLTIWMVHDFVSRTNGSPFDPVMGSRVIVHTWSIWPADL